MKKLPLGVKTGLSFGHARGAEGGARHRRYCLSGAPARSCESAQSCHSAQDRQSAAVMKSTQVKSGPFGHNQTAGTAPGSTPLSTNEAGQPQIEMSGRGQYHNNILQDTGHDTERDPLPLPSTIGVRALGVVTKNSLLVAVDTLVEEGSLDEALELLSETSTFPGISPTEKALALQKEAAILIEQKRLDEAYQKIVAVLDNAEHGPKIRAVALHNRGQYRWRISDVTGAIRDYLQSGRTKEAHPNTRIASYTNAAWLLIRERNFKEAINCCKEGLGLSPDDIALLSNLGFALLLAGQKKRAIKVYTRLWSRTTSLQQLERAGASDIRLLLECCPDTPGIHEAAAILGRRRDVLRESSGPKTLDDLLIAIQTLIDIEETTEAREILRDNLSYPPTFDVGNHLPQLTPLLEQLLRNELSKESRRMLGIVARNSNDPELYITLSELLLRDGLHGYAASILLGSHNRYPDRSNLVEPLMAALEHAGRSDEIIFFAETQGLHNLPHRAQVTYAVHQLLLGMLEQSRGTLQNITTVSDPISEDAHGEGALRDDYARLMRMLMRAEAVAQRPPTLLAPLTPDDIRGWSFVTSGSLLLHRSPHEPDMMRGRYAVAHDNALLVAECVQKAVAIFQGPLR